MSYKKFIWFINIYFENNLKNFKSQRTIAVQSFKYILFCYLKIITVLSSKHEYDITFVNFIN